MTRTMWDGINSDASAIKALAKPGDLIAYYIDGKFAWTAAEVAMFPHNTHITITVLGNPADVADCETGDLTPAEAANWVRKRRAAGYSRPTVYRSLSVMQDIRNATGELVMGRDWDAWVADYDNNTAVDYKGEAAKQYRTGSTYDKSVVYDDLWPHRTTPAAKTPVPVSAPKWPAGMVLAEPAKGYAVEALQRACRDSDIYGVRGISVDGAFGDQTKNAVRNFEANQHQSVDGIAGPLVRNAMIHLGLLNAAGQAT